MTKRTALTLLLALALLVSAVPAMAQEDEPVELRLMWYDDGNESEVMRDLLDRFEEDNPDIQVVMDIVAYKDLHNILQAQVETGEGPDMARITLVGEFLGFYLDMSPHLENPDYWTENFPTPVLNSLREGEEDEGIYGFPTQFTVTGPYINRTLFEQAGVPIPSDEKDGKDVTWSEWEEAAKQVAEATGVPYAMAIDRSGHRFWGPSLAHCATYVNDDLSFTVDTEGFRSAAQMIIDWHEEEITPLEVWAGGGGGYAAAHEFFINAQLVFYMSGSWQVQRFAEQIGDLFDWEAVPNPDGECEGSGIPGGALMVAFEYTEHPEEVARVMDYLVQEDVLGEFSARTLFIPGHLGLAEKGVEYATEDETVKAVLNVFLGEIPRLSDEAYALQYHPMTAVLNTEIRDRLSQVIVGELTLDEAIQKIQETVDEAYADMMAEG